METELGSFTISNQTLKFTPNIQAIKINVKNTSLKSTSYDINISDADHFKLMTHRMFTLAPGISKSIQFKHINGQHCHNEQKQKKTILITNSLGKSAIFHCICPKFKLKQEQKLLKVPENLNIGQFDKVIKFVIPVKNTSDSNLKLRFFDIFRQNLSFKLLSDSMIILANQSLKIEIELQKKHYGSLSQIIQFQISREEDLKYELKHQKIKKHIYQIGIEGECTSKSLIIKDDNSEISEIKLTCLNGMQQNCYFYIQNMYNRDMQYNIAASVKAQSPSEYAHKWRSTNVTFLKPQGIIKSRSTQKIHYKLNTKFSSDDQKYAKKYNKIRLNQDSCALNLRNSLYAKKNIDLIVKVSFSSTNKQQYIPYATLPIKCLIYNPSIRFQAYQNENSDQINLKIANDTKIIVPYTFSQHSLYRISKEKGQLQEKSRQEVMIKWTKNSQKCKIFAEIPDFNILVFDPKQCPSKNTITRPASRRPMTTQKFLKQRFARQFTSPNSRPASGINYRPLSTINQNQQFHHTAVHSKPVQIIQNVPKNLKQFEIIKQEELDCISTRDRTIKNNHNKITVLIQIIGEGYLKLAPQQQYSFDDDTKSTIDFKIMGHDTIFKIWPTEEKNFFFNATNTSGFNVATKDFPETKSANQYKILSKQLLMSFKEHPNQFQIIDFVPIKNSTFQPLQVHCLTVDGQFFHCKEPGNSITIPPHEIGKFKIGFMPKNIVTLKALANQPPKQSRRKAVVQSVIQTELRDDISKVKKQIKLLINKKVEIIKCVGEIVEKRCTIKPESITFTQCKYGSPQTFQSFLITCLSSKELNFYIQHPEQVMVKPKKGTISSKNAQNCSVYFKPSKKISKYQNKIKIYISGSHTEILPLIIDVEDPQIFIKQSQLDIQQYAICDSQNQELNAEMTLVNNTLSQSFVEINLNNTNLSIGFSKNHNISPNMGLIQKSFHRRAKFDIEESKDSQDQNSKVVRQTQQGTEDQVFKKCVVNVLPGSFLKVPLTVKVQKCALGENIIKIKQNVASLIGFGSIKSPQQIRFHCQKTLLHIRPYKKIHDIVLTKNQQGYKIQLKNTTKNTIKVRTQINQMKSQSQQVSIICTFKDINDYLQPEKSLTLNMNFIFFDLDKHALNAQYFLKFFVAETIEEEKNQNPYFQTQLNVEIPQPFLEINPTRLIMPTVGLNAWSHESFIITNQGFKEIFIKLKRPSNIAFQLQYTMHTYDPNSKKKSKNMQNYSSTGTGSPGHSARSLKKQGMQKHLLQNQLTKMRNSIEIKLSLRSKQPISYNVVLEIQDNFENKYEMIVAGTFTDSPFFVLDNLSVNSPESSSSIYSSKSFNSNSFLNSSSQISEKNIKKIKSQLDPIDVQDLLFLNSWLGSLIPQLSGQSAFFYVWLVKVENFIKFLKEFDITIYVQKDEKKKSLKETYKPKSLDAIFEQMKKLGFQLNSLRVELLEKADQLEWLNFMWFFFSKQIISPNFLNWISKNISQKLNYESFSKFYPTYLSTIIRNHFGLTKQKSSSDWPQLIQKFEPLLGIFKNLQSRRHLILSSNILYHRLNNLQKQIITTSGLQMNLIIENKHNKKIKYFLLCDPKNLNCQQSSKKTMPNPTNGGYTFMMEQNQTVDLLLTFRNVSVAKKISQLEIILLNNFIWDPITLYQISFKKREDVYHNVMIECQEQCSQEWVYTYKSKISSEYKLILQGDPQFKVISNTHIGYLKKGQNINIRVVYSPQSMDKHQASLSISNNLIKQIFVIKGKPIHSRKVCLQTSYKLIEGKQYQQVITIPWQLNNQSKINSVTSRASKRQGFAIFNVQFFSSLVPEINFTTAEFSYAKKQTRLPLKMNFEKKYRDLEILLRIFNKELGQSKIIKIIINVTPKPVFIRAEVQASQTPIIQDIIIPNIYKIPEAVTIQYRSVQSQQQVIKMQGRRRATQYISTDHQYAFQMPECSNGKTLSFEDKNKNQIASQLKCKIKFNPNKVSRDKEKEMFAICLTYSQSLLKIYYIFVGVVRNTIENMSEQQLKRSIKHNVVPLKKYKGQIKIWNNKPNVIKFDVSTDLHQISGNSVITVYPGTFGKYEYQVYCLHVRNKSGNILFKGKHKDEEIQYNYEIDISVTQNQSILDENELKIFRQIYQVQSIIRQKKIFTVQLLNSSDRTVQYEIICSSKYLRPACQKISIPAESQAQLDVAYIPLFVGEQKGILTFYNPYQPQITYTILMKSEPTKTQIKQSMPGIGEHKAIRLSLQNPSFESQQVFLRQVIYNQQSITTWQNHFKLINTGAQQSSSNNKFSIKSQSTLHLNLLFNPVSLSNTVKYQFVFYSEKLGEFIFHITYTYPTKQLMNSINVHIDENSYAETIIPFLNRFQFPVTLEFVHADIVKVIDCSNGKQNKFGHLILDSLTKTLIRLQTQPEGKSIKFCIKSGIFQWIYPITIYKVCQFIQNPVILKGIANQSIYTKMHPISLTSISSISIIPHKETQPLSNNLVSIKVVQDLIRKRKLNDNHILKHEKINENQVYEVQIEFIPMKSLKSAGYLYLYCLANSDKTKENKESQLNYIVQKIPYQFLIDQAPTKKIQLKANIGEKTGVKLKLSSIFSQHLTIIPKKSMGVSQKKVMDVQPEGEKQIQLKLYNNKGQQFSAYLDEDNQYVQIFYTGKEYSSLKTARLEIKVENAVKDFMLIAKYPEK